MPIVKINLMSGRTEAQKSELVKEVTAAICSTLGSEPSDVRIILDEMERHNYAVGGVLKIDQVKK